MDFQSFIVEWRGRRVDFTRDGTYTQADLISEYLWGTQQVKVEFSDSLQALYEHVPNALTATLYETQDNSLTQGDIVFMSNWQHWGIATGQQDMNEFEMLEQNAVGSLTGIGDDAIRTNVYQKSELYGVWRMRHAGTTLEVPVAVVEPEPELPPEPVEKKPHTFARGGLKVPIHREEFKMIAEIPGYQYQSFAKTGTNPVTTLTYGKYYKLQETQGMWRVDKGEGTPSYWVNPSDNAEKPKMPETVRPKQIEYKPDLDGAQEAADNYIDFKDEATGRLIEKPYRANPGGATVIEFATGNYRKMPEGALVWLAGYTSVGGIGYGIATKCMELEKPRYIGIMLGQLHEDEVFDPSTTIEERQFFHTLKPQDYANLMKAKITKRVMDIKGRK